MNLADDGFLEIAQSRLEYKMIGPRPDQAATFVLLHEGLGSVGIWGDFPARLADFPGAIVAGNGAERHAALLDAALPAGARRLSIEGPTALAIGMLALPRLARGEADDLDKAVPAYGRPPDITAKKPAV